MTKSSDAGQDRVSALGPHEGRRGRIAERDVGEDRGLERVRAPVRPALDLFVGQHREPALDQVEPGAAGRREMEMEPGPSGQPAVNHRRLVGAVGVENQVHLEVGGHGRVNRGQERSELDGPMPSVELPNDLAALGILIFFLTQSY
jgi:hypothetical protein